MMEQARHELARMRESDEAWADLAYTKVTRDGHVYDGNAVRRALVLWALQYDHGPADLPLLRWLVEQETRCRREAPYQGLGDEAELAGFLLASYREVADVWLHWALKRANFDTWCGYDEQYLVAAGVDVTLELVRAGDHPERDALLERLGELDEPDLEKWFEHKRSWFPADKADEDPLTWVDRAEKLGDLAGARSLLRLWATGRERDEATLSQLRGRYADLGAYAEAADVQRELVGHVSGASETASAQRSLAGYERRAGRHAAAWAALRACGAALADVAGWREAGLGRFYVEELFSLARDAAGVADGVADDLGGDTAGDVARAAFVEADRIAPEVPWLPLVVLDAATDAATAVGAEDRATHYRTRCDAERDRVAAELD
ncbi:MAG: hypothetical protein GEV28_29010 [Actinophytocola sp.]|uniref:hypothetical protein n=1 Tax=Actinophytocola sp. TaxID=1872138 RepID=UPI00132B02ED|nr:hypothetical protein [Actinophytocola sp.]MPZ84223.1 hypothetical protein [Actinophytocola sp.]